MILTDWILAGVAVAAFIVTINMYYDGKRTSDAAVKSADAAEKSASEAKRSADAAADSVDLTRRERDRAIERSDVEFKRVGARDGTGILKFQNVGGDIAHDVSLVLYVNGARYADEPGDVPGGDTVSFDARMDLADAEAVADKRRSSPGDSVVFVGVSAKFRVRARFTWSSALGTPFTQLVE